MLQLRAVLLRSGGAGSRVGAGILPKQELRAHRRQQEDRLRLGPGGCSCSSGASHDAVAVRIRLARLPVAWLFVEGHQAWALYASLGPSQLWRTRSDTCRADLRLTARSRPTKSWRPSPRPLDLQHRLASPERSLLFELRELRSTLTTASLQVNWMALFAFMARSAQTGAHLRFHMHAARSWPHAATGRKTSVSPCLGAWDRGWPRSRGP